MPAGQPNPFASQINASNTANSLGATNPVINLPAANPQPITPPNNPPQTLNTHTITTTATGGYIMTDFIDDQFRSELTGLIALIGESKSQEIAEALMPLSALGGFRVPGIAADLQSKVNDSIEAIGKKPQVLYDILGNDKGKIIDSINNTVIGDDNWKKGLYTIFSESEAIKPYLSARKINAFGDLTAEVLKDVSVGLGWKQRIYKSLARREVPLTYLLNGRTGQGV